MGDAANGRMPDSLQVALVTAAGHLREPASDSTAGRPDTILCPDE